MGRITDREIGLRLGAVVLVFVTFIVLGAANWAIIQPSGQGISDIDAYQLGGYLPFDFLKRAGDNMTGNLDMNGNNVNLSGGNISSGGAEFCIGAC